VLYAALRAMYTLVLAAFGEVTFWLATEVIVL